MSGEPSNNRIDILSEAQLEQFIGLYKARFNKEITRDAAREKVVKLLRLLAITYKPMAEEEFKRVQQRRQETKNNSPP